MANITNIVLSATKTAGTNNSWDITVKYIATFSQFEWSTGNFRFRDAFRLFESDEGEWFQGGDDKVTGVVGSSVFNPAAASVQRTMTCRVSKSALDTEWGTERLYAVVRLRNLDLNLLYKERSSTLSLDP